MRASGMGVLFSSAIKPLRRGEVLLTAALDTRADTVVADDSKTSNVGGRYAQALFDLANDEKSMAKVAADLSSLKKALAESREKSTVNGWMHSTLHRANLLSRKWKTVGIGFLPAYPVPTASTPVATFTTDFGVRP